VVHLQPHSNYMSGLEASAEGGLGFGIEALKPLRQGDGVKVGLSSQLPAEVVERLQRKARQAAGVEDQEGELPGEEAAADKVLRRSVLRGRGRTQWRQWGWKELATAADEDPEPQLLKDLVAESLTLWYGSLQGRSGATVGVEAGDAWRVCTHVATSATLFALGMGTRVLQAWVQPQRRSERMVVHLLHLARVAALAAVVMVLCVQIAMEEAVQAGAAQVLLADRPAFVTQRRLAQGLWAALSPRVIAGLAVFNVAIFAGGFNVIPDEYAWKTIGLTFLATGLGLLPVALPFWEMWRFSTMSAEEIEAAVRVPEPVESNLDAPLKLYGEDALLGWPGASESIIQERDAYMAKALAAAALGAPCAPCTRSSGVRRASQPLRAACREGGSGACVCDG
jgi:hypothetical protein